ncbi:hypothetical protein IU473_18660 [Nocardia farcinica]|nr:hypothetical protein [Nocardia farcinica]
MIRPVGAQPTIDAQYRHGGRASTPGRYRGTLGTGSSGPSVIYDEDVLAVDVVLPAGIHVEAVFGHRVLVPGAAARPWLEREFLQFTLLRIEGLHSIRQLRQRMAAVRAFTRRHEGKRIPFGTKPTLDARPMDLDGSCDQKLEVGGALRGHRGAPVSLVGSHVVCGLMLASIAVVDRVRQ